MRPGSYPPRCATKCGNCTPCRPAHMVVPPRAPTAAEYHPEAWRCECRGRLFEPYVTPAAASATPEAARTQKTIVSAEKKARGMHNR
ncbi:CHALLAH like [Canna indica]|uniref:Epidermal patterning factor-like protein n=1 Tax=Canna indica TaxID=4628 RepID=A0AAQ3KU84_9LILI|nr:CHALLAH like [Canna indica]